MTNFQLAILLQFQVELLQNIRNGIRDRLPEHMIESRRGLTGSYNAIPILEPFDEMITTLREQIEKLLQSHHQEEEH